MGVLTKLSLLSRRWYIINFWGKIDSVYLAFILIINRHPKLLMKFSALYLALALTFGGVM